ncbi:hypothetical protein CDA63_04335 [Hymenobacter amundsenii]|uniref:Uncharacterized protein n=1 Tax=Hymenobacter amundsenii TaxID=2006685 RepID=A0A246FR68_9BACT|nr:hypothetical protein [Hymenobacter amundsenii]OWP64274.1 hypothetical protein CDA63_04335 [Hymenobacter amundsenii]
MSDNSNQQSKENSGDPAGTGQRKSDPNSKPLANDDDQQKLADEYTEDGLDKIPPHLVNNPNRNYDKPDLDKPAYS